MFAYGLMVIPLLPLPPLSHIYIWMIVIIS
jgi:hypothetical protein